MDTTLKELWSRASHGIALFWQGARPWIENNPITITIISALALIIIISMIVIARTLPERTSHRIFRIILIFSTVVGIGIFALPKLIELKNLLLIYMIFVLCTLITYFVFVFLNTTINRAMKINLFVWIAISLLFAGILMTPELKKLMGLEIENQGSTKSTGSAGSKTVIDVFTGVVTAFGYLALATAVASILYRLHQAALTPHKIIIKTFINASGKKELDAQKDYFTLRLREQVVRDIKELKNRINQLEEKGEKYRAPLSRFPVPLFQSGQEQEQIQSLVEEGTKRLPQESSWIPQFTTFLFPAKSTLISCAFLLNSEVGEEISLEIVDTDYRAPSVVDKVSAMPCQTETFNLKARYEKLIPKLTETFNLKARYEKLIPKLSEVLAIEIVKQDMLDISRLPFQYRFSGRPWRRKRHQAKVYNAIGVLYMAYAKGRRDSFFYQHAIENFQLAIDTDKIWWFPYANLADIHSIKGEEALALFNADIAKSPDEQKQGLLEKALSLQLAAQSEYDQALVYINHSFLLRKYLLKREQEQLRELHKMISEAEEMAQNADTDVGKFGKWYKPIAYRKVGIPFYLDSLPSSIHKLLGYTQEQIEKAKEMLENEEKNFQSNKEDCLKNVKQDVVKQHFYGKSDILKKMPWFSKKKGLDYRTRIAKSRAKLLEAETYTELNRTVASSYAIDEAQYELTLLGKLSKKMKQNPDEALGKQRDVQLLWYLASWYGVAHTMKLTDDLVSDLSSLIGTDIKNRLFCLLAYCLVRSAPPLSMYKGSNDRDSALIDFALKDQSADALEDPYWYYWRRIDSDLDFGTIKNRRDFKKKLSNILMEEDNLMKNYHNDLSQSDCIKSLIKEFEQK